MFRISRITYSEKSDEQLMQYICKGDRSAFECLYDRYFNKLVWFAQRFVEELEASQDIVQEVFMKIIEKPEKFDTERKFSSWVYTVTGNACRNHARNVQTRTRILESRASDNVNSQEHTLDYGLLRKKLNAAYSGLSEKEKNLFVLRFEQELSLKEIADILSIPEGTAKSGIYYMLKKISTHLKDFNHGH